MVFINTFNCYIIVVRIIISTLFCSSLVRLRKVSTKRYGRSIGVYFIVITLCQFHLLYYSSRPLPNVFATICTTFGFAYWIEEVLLLLFISFLFYLNRNIELEYSVFYVVI